MGKWLMLAAGFLLSAPAVHAAAGLNLPLVEVAAAGRTQPRRFAVMFSGDGGWARIDKAIAGELARGGMPVVGINSLQYFWTTKAPETIASDLASIIETYAVRWNAPQVVLIGYSRGADVLPFAVNRLSGPTRGRIALVALLSPSKTVTFEFRMTDWFSDRAGLPTKAEIERMQVRNAICVYGTDDRDTVCTDVTALQRVPLSGAHHFDGDYASLARIITSRLAP
jgi:type IV secretory pathway VirJ component